MSRFKDGCVVALVVLIAGCSSEYNSSDSIAWRAFKSDKGLEIQMIAAFMNNNQSLHIRDWVATYLQRGTVDPTKANRVSDQRIKAAIGCFNWINEDSGYESKMDMCIYFLGPSTRNSNEVQLVWGNRNRVEGIAAQDDFKPT